MIWYNEETLSGFFQKYDYDIRKSSNARWIDQKCTPDVVCLVADCIENFISRNNVSEFTSMDIWKDDYTSEFVQSIFSKPDLNIDESKREYDKFFQQPMELLSYSRVLKKTKRGSRNFYSLSEPDILSFIAFRERNSLIFLQEYIYKVLKDSNLSSAFDRFFVDQTYESFIDMKTSFEIFTIQFTPINHVVECRRIFTKILNPLSFKKGKLGTEKGRISRHPITYDMLMYNRDNFRDIYSEKPKSVTRAEFMRKKKIRPNQQYVKYASAKAKRLLRYYNDTYMGGLSEVQKGPGVEGIASHIHHIFPDSQFPEISGNIENLIAITPTQHLSYAHPSGNTQAISKDYQYLCIVSKSDSIKKNICSADQIKIYSFENFQQILNVGFSTSDFSEVDYLDFDGLVSKVEQQYSST